MGISLLFGFDGLAMKGLSTIFLSVWPAPNLNSCGGTSAGGRAKMDAAPMVLKAGAGSGSLAFGKPKVKDAAPEGWKIGMVGLMLSIDPKILRSYSCNCS